MRNWLIFIAVLAAAVLSGEWPPVSKAAPPEIRPERGPRPCEDICCKLPPLERPACVRAERVLL